jgi:hypothetical protein
MAYALYACGGVDASGLILIGALKKGKDFMGLKVHKLNNINTLYS